MHFFLFTSTYDYVDMKRRKGGSPKINKKFKEDPCGYEEDEYKERCMPISHNLSNNLKQLMLMYGHRMLKLSALTTTVLFWIDANAQLIHHE